MNILQIAALSLFMSGCANARPSVTFAKLDLTGDLLPEISHVTDMKISGDTLFFVYESKGGHGQRFLRRAIIDDENNTLRTGPDMGKRNDGYYLSYMPYPFIAADGSIRVVSQDDCEIYSVGNDTAFVSTRQYLMDGNSAVPFPLSQYVQDIFMTAPDRYVFVGREPNGGRQYAMTADLTAAKIDTIRQIAISPQLQAWMPNTGELAYSRKHKRLAFSYKLHPVIEIFDLEGNIISSVRLSDDTFKPETLDEADFSDLNVLHTVDVTYTSDYIYALYWGFRYSDFTESNPTILKIDCNGNLIARYSNLPPALSRIAALNDSTLLARTPQEFLLISL